MIFIVDLVTRPDKFYYSLLFYEFLAIILNIKERKPFFKIRLKNKKSKMMYFGQLKFTEKFQKNLKIHLFIFNYDKYLYFKLNLVKHVIFII